MILPCFSLISKENSPQKKALVFSAFYGVFLHSETLPENACFLHFPRPETSRITA